MRAGEERCRKVVFKEHLSGEEGLSYRGWWGLETPRIALPWSDEWWGGSLQLWPREGGVGGWNALHCNCSRSLRGGRPLISLYSLLNGSFLYFCLLLFGLQLFPVFVFSNPHAVIWTIFNISQLMFYVSLLLLTHFSCLIREWKADIHFHNLTFILIPFDKLDFITKTDTISFFPSEIGATCITQIITEVPEGDWGSA